MSRYARQELIPAFGASGQAKLTSARVLVVGAGGLAAPALPLLAGAGIGHITVVDPDVVELTNLHRQTLFAETDQGQPKAQIAAARCRALNSEIKVEGLVDRLTPETVATLLDGVDIVLDCADSYAVSYILSDHCLARKIPLISASVLDRSGYVGGFCGSAPSLRAVFPDAPQSAATCATSGVMGPVVSMLGAAQAQFALAVLLGQSPSPLGQMLRIDMASFRTTSFRFDQAPEPTSRFAFISTEALSATDRIIELRDETEAPALLHPNAIRIAPHNLTAKLTPRSERLVLSCATGLRAWRAAETLQDHWPGEIVLVAASAS